MEILVERHPELLIRAFVARWRTPLGRCRSFPQIAALLDAPFGRCELSPPDDTVRASIRDVLRHSGFKPTGRSKPSSEYLLRARGEGQLRSINPAVDACNAISLHSGLPISVVDCARLTPPLRVQPNRAGDRARRRTVSV